MKTISIIAEYNPFHNGHAWQIAEAKRRTSADFALIVMSGDFVQRGEPAVLDKFSRTRMALLGGADLVLELPVRYAAGSAEYFARGACSLVASLNETDTLCFGCETEDPAAFSALSSMMSQKATISASFTVFKPGICLLFAMPPQPMTATFNFFCSIFFDPRFR